MAVTTPILLSVSAFDATLAQTFTFNSVGGDQVVKNQLTIRLNSDNSVVYQQQQTTFLYQHTVPANTLTNGNYYNAYINTYDSAGNVSANSNVIQFYCYSAPSLTITNVSDGGTIGNSTFTFDFTYSQAQSEPLNSYVVNLYDESQLQIATSGQQYPSSTTVPLNFTYTFNGFENNTFYYIQVVGVTLNGTSVQTPQISFTAVFDQPSAFTLFTVANNCDGGYINVQSNVVTIPGTANPNPPAYINNEELDLTASGSYVQYNENINIGNQFTGLLRLRNINTNQNIITFTASDGTTISIDYYISIVDSSLTEKAYAALTATQGGYSYFIHSDPQTPPTDETTPVLIQFNRSGNLYNIVMTIG